MKKQAIYYRVSTTKQDIDSQKMEVENYLASQQINLASVKIYSDIGLSGKHLNRPEFLNMLADAQQGKIENIIVYKLDRFSRSASTAIRLILELDEMGVGFISVSQKALNLGTDVPFRRTMLSAFAEIAQIERETTVERIKAGLNAAKKRGVKLGRRVKITDRVKDNILALREEGLSIRQIAKKVGFSRNSVHKIINI